MKLYKYYSKVKYLSNLIINNKLYLSDLSTFNDPFEKYFFFREQNGALSFSDDYKNYFRACCFTIQPNNFLMWSHYANKHKGFCVEFDFPFELTNDINWIKIDNRYVGLVKIDYKPKLIVLSFDKPLNDDEKMETIRYKSECWNYEKEIRFVTSSKYRNLTINKNNITNIFFNECTSASDKDIIPGIKFEVREED